MATRSIQFFMRPSEFSEAVWEAAARHGLTVILLRYGKNRHFEIAEPGSVLMSDGDPPDELYFAAQRPDLTRVHPQHKRPGEWGWVNSGVPSEEDNILYEAQMAAKSDWWDREKRQVLENPESLELFRKVAPAFRKRLKRPLWVHNVRGGKGRAYRDIGYSAGVTEWVEHGGELRQRGVANIRFSIEKPERDDVP